MMMIFLCVLQYRVWRRVLLLDDNDDDNDGQ